jgi:PhnB protein
MGERFVAVLTFPSETRALEGGFPRAVQSFGLPATMRQPQLMSKRRKSSRRPKRARRSSGSTPVRRRTPAPVSVKRMPPQDAASGLAPGMHPINTYLAVANVGATMDFLERALGLTRGVVLPDADGQIRYAEMRHGESVVMLIRKGDSATATGGSPALYAYVSDVDAVAAQARQAGGGVGDAQDMPWGDRTAVVTDPDGYRWVLATFKKLAPFT